MKAITVPRLGGPEVLTLADLPEPTLGPKDALVRVALAGVNFGEIVLRSGRAPFEVPLPFVPGVEAAGVVVALGEEAAATSGLAIGARVAAPLFTTGRLFGGYATCVAFDAERLVLLPDDIGYEEAIALQVQGISAWLLFDHAPCEGCTVLVNAAAGGTGSLLVQLAKERGAARVFAAASTPEKRALAHELGADDVVDYTDSKWPDHVLEATGGAGVDVIFDSVAGDVRRRSFEALAVGGTLVVLGYSSEIGSGGADDGIDGATVRQLFFKRQAVKGFLWTHFADPTLATRTMTALFERVRRGSLRIVRGGTFPLARAADAHRALVSRATTGKLFITP